MKNLLQGQTGFPWIDAIMTQLREEGNFQIVRVPKLNNSPTLASLRMVIRIQYL